MKSMMSTRQGKKPYPSIEKHCHTNCSDGLLSPRELVDEAIAAKLTHIVITDHDTVLGYEAAVDIVPPELVLIPGIEVSSVSADGRDVHMLGYYIDTKNERLLDVTRSIRDRRTDRCEKMLDNIKNAGYDMSADEITSKNLIVNRTNIARLALSKGLAPSFGDAFENFVGENSPFYVDREDIDVYLVLEIIIDAGGIPVIAHPAHYHVVDLIDPLVKRGLRGIECFHSEQTVEDSIVLMKIARERGLLVTGGSDYHGDNVHPARLGGSQPPLEDIYRFLESGQ